VVLRWRRDGAIAAAVFALCLLGGVLQIDDTVAPPRPSAYLIAAVSAVLTLARHRAPVATVAATTACGMIAAPWGLLVTPLTVAPTVVSAYSLALNAGRRTTLAVLVPCAALLTVLTPFAEEDFSWEDTSRLITVAAAPLVAAVFARLTRHRRTYLAFMEERALRAERSREDEARRRVAGERVRIARELHDLVAHQITLANAQASVAAHLFDTRPAQARASLDELVKTTRQALDELRATVGLLRQDEDASAPTEPAPGLAQLPELVASFGRAGLEVSVAHEGAVRQLSPAVDLTAYRIILEALTNVTKHAGAGQARVRLTWARDLLRITVSDDGAGPRQPGPQGAPGYGLIGMQERAGALGGELTAGVRPEGGFLVTAHLPAPAADATPARGVGRRALSEDR